MANNQNYKPFSLLTSIVLPIALGIVVALALAGYLEYRRGLEPTERIPEQTGRTSAEPVQPAPVKPVQPEVAVKPSTEGESDMQIDDKVVSVEVKARALMEYLDLMGRVIASVSAGQSADAKQSVSTWLAQNAAHLYHSSVTSEPERIDRAASVLASLLQGSETLRGVPVILSEGFTSQVDRVEGGAVFFVGRKTEGTVGVHLKLSELSPLVLIQLLQHLDPTNAPANLAAYHLSRGEIERAMDIVKDQTLKGRNLGFVEQWARAWESVSVNRQAARAVAAIESTVNQRDFRRASSMMQQANQLFATSDIFQWAMAEQIDRLASAIEAGLAGQTEATPTAPSTSTFKPDSDFTAASLMRPDVRKRIGGGLETAINGGDWKDYLAYVDRGLLTILKSSAAFGHGHQFDSIVKADMPAQLLAQSAAMRRAGTSALNAMAEDQDRRGFLRWLFGNRDAMEDFVMSIAPETDARKILGLWADLWQDTDPKLQNKYAPLALACALVFQNPVSLAGAESYQTNGITMGGRYKYFIDASEKKELKTEIDKMPAWQLVWVVDAHVPDSELDWARRHVSHSQKTMGKAYSDIRYRMDKISKGNSIYKDYTLAEIKKEGGTCGDQAHYSSTAAKAHGIPAMVIAGDGDLGGHAWMGYMESSHEWNLTAGRINANYANGGTTDPQTRKPLSEKGIQLLADSQRRTENWLLSHQMVWLAALFDANNLRDQEAIAFGNALDFASRNMTAFNAYIAFLKDAKTPVDTLRHAIAEMRVAFRNYPDELKTANELDTDLTLREKGAVAAAKEIHRQTKRMGYKFQDRTDIVMQNVDREVDMLVKAGKTNEADRVYRQALFEHADEVVSFKQLVSRYMNFARKQNAFHDAVWYVNQRFRQSHPRPSANSYFEATTWAGLLDMMADLFDEDGNRDKAERMRRDANRMKKMASEMTK